MQELQYIFDSIRRGKADTSELPDLAKKLMSASVSQLL